MSGRMQMIAGNGSCSEPIALRCLREIMPSAFIVSMLTNSSFFAPSQGTRWTLSVFGDVHSISAADFERFGMVHPASVLTDMVDDCFEVIADRNNPRVVALGEATPEVGVKGLLRLELSLTALRIRVSLSEFS